MNCSRFETLLTDYIDRALPAPVREAVREHLRTCASCRTLRDEVVSLLRQLESFPMVDPPETLVERILVRTSGKPKERSLWSDLFVPTIRPFMTQRFAFATLVLFVFLSLMVNLVGPPAAAVLSPQRLAESADRMSNQISKRWAEAQALKTRIGEELWLLSEDLYGRLDYYLVSMLFRSYSESAREEQVAEEEAAEQSEQSEEQVQQ